MYIYREMSSSKQEEWREFSGINKSRVFGNAVLGNIAPPDSRGTLPSPSSGYAGADGGGYDSYEYGLAPHLPTHDRIGLLPPPHPHGTGGNINNLLAPGRTGCNVGELESPLVAGLAASHSETEQRQATEAVSERLAEFKGAQAQLLGAADYRQYGDGRGIVYYVAEAEAGKFANALKRFEELRDHIARSLYGEAASTVNWTDDDLGMPNFVGQIRQWATDEDGMGQVRDDGTTELTHDFVEKAHWFAHARNGGADPSPCKCGKSCKITAEGDQPEPCTCAAAEGGAEFFQSRRRYRRA